MKADLQIHLEELPKCPDCGNALLPFPDFTQQTNELFLRGWACWKCDQALMYKNGQFEKCPVKALGPGH